MDVTTNDTSVRVPVPRATPDDPGADPTREFWDAVWTLDDEWQPHPDPVRRPTGTGLASPL